jgi:hypothetical protein
MLHKLVQWLLKVIVIQPIESRDWIAGSAWYFLGLTPEEVVLVQKRVNEKWVLILDEDFWYI